MKLEELKATYFQEEKKYDFLFPIGSTEQHGCFIPFGTDTYITDYLVGQVSKLFSDLIILPTLEISRSKEHRGLYGTLWLSENTLKAVMFDICNSLKDKARNIFITSFHANELFIKDFIENNIFKEVKIVYLQIANEEDDANIEKILGGRLDDHAGNTEISNMLVINRDLVQLPERNCPKSIIENPFETDDLIEKCPSGIADNHPRWIISESVGKKILEIYLARMITNLKDYL